MARLSQLVAIAAIVAATSATAGTVCHGSVITGFERQAEIAALTLGAPTSDPAAMRVYTEATPRAWYYQSNFVRPGQRHAAKIVSEVPLTPRQIVQNMMFVSRAEIDANTTATALAMRALAPAVQFASIE